jgi:hypothetical protein
VQLLHHTLQGSSCFFGLHFSVGRNAAPSPDPSFASRMQQPCGGFSSSAVPRFNMLAGSSARSIHGAKLVQSYVTSPTVFQGHLHVRARQGGMGRKADRGACNRSSRSWVHLHLASKHALSSLALDVESFWQPRKSNVSGLRA